ncbi:hypothetical protein ISF_01975 [Cordyceps fumosorosea ARSEF 2679]|uniref:Siderophore esterase IroE-like protein n=1 Tax=Cordyceps fumosorosea (strain ARSEF 2679) TaxID=1081104 RepID=A0A162LJH8_CORFA|nr:hypothetical protein ISF_01975 [Cordyceps fumosorosea ARSEF 2679]OAA71424.1 hypothetical protein ISF_01975 [Cordyceps fumosorosea ARSEF 2679]
MTTEVTASRQGYLQNSTEYIARTERGEFLVQVAWPLSWSQDRVRPENDSRPVSAVYLVDGNVFFGTTVDISRRLEFTDDVRNVVVAVGYPRSNYVYDFRRGPDLTPPTPDGQYEMPLGQDGKPRTDLKFGDADKFLDFIQNHVMVNVQETLFPHVQLTRKALFGHSYGGVFSLHTLFTRPCLFDFYIAASPTIWWSNYALVKNQERELHRRTEPADPAPSLLITWGTSADELEKRPGESDDAFKKRIDIAEGKEMGESATSLVGRLRECPSIKDVWTCHFPGEDHGSAAVVGLQRGIMNFLIEMTN